jgi:hypothetical protein
MAVGRLKIMAGIASMLSKIEVIVFSVALLVGA